MPFLLDGNPTQGELSEAVNYLLSNFSQSVTADPSTGQIIGPGGDVQSYLYKYMYIKYATSFDGSVGFSNVPTNATYYGLRNTDDPTESTNPADYVWTKVSPSFGTTYFLYYLTTGGRSIQFQEATSVPNPGWEIDPGTAIDLDFVTNVTNTPANFVVIRVANNSAAPTNAEVLSAIGRLPIDGDLCTVNYNSGLYSLTFKYTTGWAIFQKYITGDLIVAQSIVGNNIAANTITAGNIAANTITASQIAANTITAGNMNVAQLSAITANMGSITAGDLSIGSSPAISGTSMTGTGAHLYSSGNFVFGNPTTNIVFDGSQVYLNGFIQTLITSSYSTYLNPSSSSKTTLLTFTVSRTGAVIIVISGEAIGYYTQNTTGPSILGGSILTSPNIGIYDSSNTFISNFNCGSMEIAPIYTAASTQKATTPLNDTCIVNLTAGTYTVQAWDNNTRAYIDTGASAGGNSYCQLYIAYGFKVYQAKI